MIHEHENNSDTESFLKSNGKKFNGDCLTAMKLMYEGIRLSSQDCWVKYGFHDRRLRNCRAARPDIVKSDWVYVNGKRSYVEYWIDKPKIYPTKTELNQWLKEYLEGKYDDKPPTPVIDIHRKYFTQGELWK